MRKTGRESEWQYVNMLDRYIKSSPKLYRQTLLLKTAKWGQQDPLLNFILNLFIKQIPKNNSKFK